MTTRAYWFFGDTLRNGQPIPADGEWLEVKGPLKLCEHGLHASLEPFDALRYAPGPNLALVELDGDVVRGDDKLCASRRRIITRIDATSLLRKFARQQALSVIHLWDAPPVVRAYLETGDEDSRSAARSAAWAAWAAAATWVAATWAAWAAWAAAQAGATAGEAAQAGATVGEAAWAAAAAEEAWVAAAEEAAWAARAAARQQFNSAVFQHMARAQTRIGEMS